MKKTEGVQSPLVAPDGGYHGRLESLNGRLRDEFLNVNVFRNLFELRREALAWLRD